MEEKEIFETNLIGEPSSVYGTKDFTDLICWKKARELRIFISDLVKHFPPEEKFRLSDQLIRASRSVTDNIPEGYGRYYFKDNVRFCYKGRGSLQEVKNHLLKALDEGFNDAKSFSNIDELKTETNQLHNGYIRYLIGRAKEEEKSK